MYKEPPGTEFGPERMSRWGAGYGRREEKQVGVIGSALENSCTYSQAPYSVRNTAPATSPKYQKLSPQLSNVAAKLLAHAQSEKAAEEAANAARSSPASMFRCEFHGPNSTHATKDCLAIKGAASRAEKQKKRRKKPKEESGNAAAEPDVEPASHVVSVSVQSYEKVSAY
ncbi:hypothetical protein PENSPDRAFT_671885, partial [Peniophora sp. CONT]